MKNSMRVFAAAGVALLGVSPASAQESGHLSAEFLKQATPLIHWPKGLEPRNVDVFVHNEGLDRCAPGGCLEKPGGRLAVADVVFQFGGRPDRKRPRHSRARRELPLENLRLPD